MNPYSGELRELSEGDAPDGFERLPKRLDMIARLKMAEAARADHPQPAIINLRSTTPLADWAKKKRLAKIASKSRRRNRR